MRASFSQRCSAHAGEVIHAHANSRPGWRGWAARPRHFLISYLRNIYLINKERCQEETRGDINISPWSPGTAMEEEFRRKPCPFEHADRRSSVFVARVKSQPGGARLWFVLGLLQAVVRKTIFFFLA